jgi:hypothetical protein
MLLGIVVGTLAGSWLLTSTNTEYASVGLGSALVLYTVADPVLPSVRHDG